MLHRCYLLRPDFLKTDKSLTYLLLGISKPGSSDALQYFWILQYGTGAGAFLAGLQYFTLFPRRVGFLIGLANGLAHASSIWPQLWLILIRKQILTYSQIMFFWAGLGNFLIFKILKLLEINFSKFWNFWKFTKQCHHLFWDFLCFLGTMFQIVITRLKNKESILSKHWRKNKNLFSKETLMVHYWHSWNRIWNIWCHQFI